MAQFESKDSDQLRFTSGGGCVMLFLGAPFLLSGAGGMIAALVVGPSQGVVATCAGLLFGSFFAVVGAGLAFGRAGVVLDKVSGTVTRWWGLLGYTLYSKTQDIKFFEWVAVTRELRGTGKNRYIAYPVALVGKEKLEIATPRNELEGRRKAEQIAGHLQLDLVDSIAGKAVRRKPDELDQSLRERLKPEDVAISAPPPGMRSTFSAAGNHVIFEIPPRNFSKLLLVPVLGILLFAGAVYFILLNSVLNINGHTRFKWIAGGVIIFFFMLLPVIGVLGAVLRLLLSRKTVEASPEKLEVRTKGLLFNSLEEISSDKLEELRIDTKHTACLLALSDQKAIRFGQGLAKDELEWMRKVLMRALST